MGTRTTDSAYKGVSRMWIATPSLVGVSVAVACIAGYLELAEDLALSPRVMAFDTWLTAAIHTWRTPLLTGFFSAVTASASTLVVAAIVLVAVVVLMWRCEHREALVIALVVASGTALGTVAKRATQRPRPPAIDAIAQLPTSYSFPSGHTLAALLLWTVIAFAVVRVTPRPWPRAAAIGGGLLLTALVGTSRVYLGVHWPSDVLASWLLGGAWLALTLGAFLSWERRYGREDA